LDGYNAAESAKCAKFAKDNGVKVSLDINTISKDTDKLLHYVDFLIVPEVFLLEYTKSDNIKYGLKKIYKSINPELCIVTLGSKGSMAIINNEIIKVEAFNVKVKDTTGAGDAYHGAAIFGLLNDWSIKNIMIFASAVSAINCTSLGGRGKLPSFQENINFLKKHDIDTSDLKLNIL
jgi:sulfofructose kinase